MTYGQTVAHEITKRAFPTEVKQQETGNVASNDNKAKVKDNYRQQILSTIGQPQQQGQ